MVNIVDRFFHSVWTGSSLVWSGLFFLLKKEENKYKKKTLPVPLQDEES